MTSMEDFWACLAPSWAAALEKISSKLDISSIKSSAERHQVTPVWPNENVKTGHHCVSTSTPTICSLARWQVFERLLKDWGHHLIPHFNWWPVGKLLLLLNVSGAHLDKLCHLNEVFILSRSVTSSRCFLRQEPSRLRSLGFVTLTLMTSFTVLSLLVCCLCAHLCWLTPPSGVWADFKSTLSGCS